MKLGRKLISLLLTLVMVFSLTATASAATTETVTVKLSPNITVTLDGEAQAMADVKGNPVYPVLYGGTTYLPVRAVGNMLGLGVDWDQATQTVLLSDPEDGKTAPGNNTNVKTPANAKPTDVTVSIDPNIIVRYNGKARLMKDVNGNRVYPMLYGGTTYLPVRAVGNMLGLDVGWDQTTQTVILETAKPIIFTIDFPNMNKIFEYGPDDRDLIPKDLGSEDIGFDAENIEPYLNEFDTMLGYWKEGRLETKADEGIDPFDGAQTSRDAKVLGDKHISYDWAELDWSTANKGYVRVKVDGNIAGRAGCTAKWYSKANDESRSRGLDMDISLIDGWFNLPLWQSNGEYECVVTVRMYGFTEEYYANGDRSVNDTLQARFTAKIDDPDSVWLMSHVKADYENAPNAVAKAKELTRNCKTDAEKIEAVFKFVANNISYDDDLLAREEADKMLAAKRDLNPDHILSSGKGVCEHYAVLMTAMLRSQGIPCKLVTGWIKRDGEWIAHGWVAVKPETGTLNLSALGAGKDYDHMHERLDANGNVVSDPTGWIRLDPTWGRTVSERARAAIDSNYKISKWW